jgi:hypothetical protein
MIVVNTMKALAMRTAPLKHYISPPLTLMTKHLLVEEENRMMEGGYIGVI